MNSLFSMSPNHRPVQNEQKSLEFLKLLKELLINLNVIYPECASVSKYIQKLYEYDGKIPDKHIAEIAASKWNHEFEKQAACNMTGYQLCDYSYFAELLNAGIKPLTELDMLQKWHDPSTDDETRQNLICYVQQLNLLCRECLGIPIPKIPVPRTTTQSDPSKISIMSASASTSTSMSASASAFAGSSVSSSFSNSSSSSSSSLTSSSSCSSSVSTPVVPVVPASPSRKSKVIIAEPVSVSENPQQPSPSSDSFDQQSLLKEMDLQELDIMSLLGPAALKYCPPQVLQQVQKGSLTAIEAMIKNGGQLPPDFNMMTMIDQMTESLTEADRLALEQNAVQILTDPGIQQMMANPLAQSHLGQTLNQTSKFANM